MEGQASLLEKLKSGHSREKKEMQAKIAALKHSVTKNDKKKKKEVSLQIVALEKELKERHEYQLKVLQHDENPAILGVAKTEGQENGVELSLDPIDISGAGTHKKPSKAQIRRDKKIETEKRRALAAETDEKNAEKSQGKIEMDEIRRILSESNLQLIDIAPDGDCLYNALSHQADSKKIGSFTGKALRKQAARYIREHSGDFLPFLMNAVGETMDEREFAEYCENVERTAQEGGAWGGEPELRAISAVLKCRIEVIQPNGQITRFGEEFTSQSDPLMITYHRFFYSLGEHYNSTLLISAS